MKRSPLRRKTPLRRTGFRRRYKPKRKNGQPTYRELVWQHSAVNAPPRPPSPNGEEWTLDHIVPISYGQRKGIPAELIGSAENLQWLVKNDNIQKGQRLYLPTQRLLLKKWGYPLLRPSDLGLLLTSESTPESPEL